VNDGSRAILSIDGGGIRGIIPAIVLNHIEQETGKPIADLFDVIAGTSTGGILALGLTKPGRDGGPALTALDLVGLYEGRGEKIFPPSRFAFIRRLTNEKYSAVGLTDVLQETLGDARISQAVTDVIVTAYDIERRAPVFFRTAKAKEAPEGYDFLMRDVARATSAAPTYFEPLRLAAVPPQPDYTLVDGGVFANNPAMCAFVDADAGRARSEETLMVSLGTGALTRVLPYDEARDWGLAGWAPHLLDVAFDGVSDTVDYQLRQILQQRYHRFQTDLDIACDDLDDARPENIDNLKLQADGLIEQNRARLDEVCEELASRVAA
jgi:uncharacterized protein